MSKTHEGLCPKEYENIRYIKRKEKFKDYSNGDVYRPSTVEERRIIPYESNDEWNRIANEEADKDE